MANKPKKYKCSKCGADMVESYLIKEKFRNIQTYICTNAPDCPEKRLDYERLSVRTEDDGLDVVAKDEIKAWVSIMQLAKKISDLEEQKIFFYEKIEKLIGTEEIIMCCINIEDYRSMRRDRIFNHRDEIKKLEMSIEDAREEQIHELNKIKSIINFSAFSNLTDLNRYEAIRFFGIKRLLNKY